MTYNLEQRWHVLGRIRAVLNVDVCCPRLAELSMNLDMINYMIMIRCIVKIMPIENLKWHAIWNRGLRIRAESGAVLNLDVFCPRLAEPSMNLDLINHMIAIMAAAAAYALRQQVQLSVSGQWRGPRARHGCHVGLEKLAVCPVQLASANWSRCATVQGFCNKV